MVPLPQKKKRDIGYNVPYMMAKLAAHEDVMAKLQPVRTNLLAHLPKINSLEAFSNARKLVRDYGLERLKRELLAPGFVDKVTGHLTSERKPMNVFAMVGAGKLDMVTPGWKLPPQELQQRRARVDEANRMLAEASREAGQRRNGGDPQWGDRFMIMYNMPRADDQWEDGDSGKASMSKRHRFMIIRHRDTSADEKDKDGSFTNRNSKVDLDSSGRSTSGGSKSDGLVARLGPSEFLRSGDANEDDYMDQSWRWFNVVTMGMLDPDPDGDETLDATSLEETKDELVKALQNVQEMRAAAYAWVERTARDAHPEDVDRGWTQNEFGVPHLEEKDANGYPKHIGLYFHCYPHATINSLHLHIIDEYPGNFGRT
tara:strand:+ start:509 stop:1621 length:1113 start_codon:yes stop_codon:yes gene_type:complete